MWSILHPLRTLALDIVFIYVVGMATEPAATTGALMRKAREKLGKSQADIAKELGKTQPTISEWEAGTAHPRVDDLRRVARVYGLRLAQLIPAERAA